MEIDAKLYKEFLMGNQKSFEELVNKYRKNLIYFIQGYVNNIDIAEDLAQDVFVYILINRKDYDFKYSMKTYLYTIARSRALNYLKREKRIIALQENIDYQNDSQYINQLEELVFTNDKSEKIRKVIKRLNKNQQQLILLSDIENLRYKDISRITGKTVTQIKMTIYRARKNLKKILEKEGFSNGQ